MDSPQTKDKLEKIKDLVEQAELKMALEELDTLGKELKLVELNKEISQLIYQFEDSKKDSLKGITQYENIKIEKNKIVDRLLELIGKVADGSINDSPVEPITPIEVPTETVAITPPPNQSISKILDYIFLSLIVLVALTCIGGLVFTFISDDGSIPSGLISMSGIFGCLFSMNSWRSKLGVRTVLQTVA